MIDDYAVARPYAHAAFEYAVKQGTLDAWSDAIEILAFAVQNDKLANLLNNPNVNQQQVIDILTQVVNTTDAGIKNFILLLAQYKRLLIAPAVFELFQQLKLKHEKILHVDVTSAFELAETQMTQLRAALTKKFNHQVTLQQHVDPSLIGGLAVRMGDFVIDNSILGKINRFKAHLNLKETVCHQ